MLLARLFLACASFSLGASLLRIPLSNEKGWVFGKFSGITPNQIQFTEKGLSLWGHASASPLFYKIDHSVLVSRLKVSGVCKTLPTLTANVPEGTGDNDDFVLRLGLITDGEKRLRWFERLFAPSWLKQVLDINPELGLGKVYFYIVAQKLEVGLQGFLNRSAYIQDTVAAQKTRPSPFDMDVPFFPPLSVFAIWLQGDSDDTKSDFAVDLTRLELTIR